MTKKEAKTVLKNLRLRTVDREISRQPKGRRGDLGV